MPYPLYPSSPSLGQVNVDQLKQELFVRTNYIDSLTREFLKVKNLPLLERQSWIDDNMQLMGSFLEKLMTDSELAVEGSVMDVQAMEMSAELMTKLRHAASLMRQIVQEKTDFQA